MLVSAGKTGILDGNLRYNIFSLFYMPQVQRFAIFIPIADGQVQAGHDFFGHGVQRGRACDLADKQIALAVVLDRSFGKVALEGKGLLPDGFRGFDVLFALCGLDGHFDSSLGAQIFSDEFGCGMQGKGGFLGAVPTVGTHGAGDFFQHAVGILLPVKQDHRLKDEGMIPEGRTAGPSRFPVRRDLCRQVADHFLRYVLLPAKGVCRGQQPQAYGTLQIHFLEPVHGCRIRFLCQCQNV